MKSIPLLIVMLLLAIAVPASAQSLKQLEKKAKKTFEKEAFGMALYYSQAILKLDSGHVNAKHWVNNASEKLHLFDKPLKLMAKAPVPSVSPLLLDVLTEKKVENMPVTIPLVVTTFNALDSSTLYGTYIGITNDGFGTGDFLQNGPAENMAVFQIPKGEFFTITGTKNRYSSGTSTIHTNQVDKPDTLYCQLYLSPSWGLPISLYFDHGKPNALHPTDSTTNMTYESAWLDFLYRIDEYIDSNTVSDNMIDKAKAQTEVGLFFANEVDANFQQLQSLCELLIAYLKKGNKITLAIEGYASLSEQTTENEALIARRLQSVENYFSFYENGRLKPWLASGDLKIIRQYVVKNEFGKTMGNPSAFDLRVAKSRKVVVRMVEVR